MIIEELELENFRSHRNAKIEFGRGITLVLGENGAGKTSIFEAINFALFKEKSSNLKIDELITTGEKRMKIRVKFLSDGRKYKALRVRELAGKAEDALYEISDGKQKVLCRGEKETKSEIEKILKLSTKTFSNAVYIKQGEIDKFLFLEPSEKKEYIGKLLGTDALEASWERAQALIKDYEAGINALEGVAEMIKEAGEKIEREAGEAKALEENLREMELKIEAKQLKIKTLEDKEKKTDSVCRAILVKKNLASEKAQMEKKVKEINEYETKLQGSKEIYEKYSRIEKELDEINKQRIECGKYSRLDRGLEERLKSLIGKSLETSKKIEKIKKELKEKLGVSSDVEEIEKIGSAYQKEKERIEKEKLSLRGEIEKTAKERGNLQSSIEALEKAIKTLDGAEKSCPVCSAPLTGEHKSKILQEYGMKRSEYEKKLRELEIREGETKRKEKEAELRHRTLQDINIELLKKHIEDKKEASKEAEKIREEREKNKTFILNLEKVERQISEKNREKGSFESGRNAYIAAKDFLEKEQRNKESYLKQVEKLSIAIEEHMKTISESGIPEGYAETELKNLKIQLEKERKEFLIFEKEKSGSEGQVKEKKKLIENLKNEIDSLKQKEKEREKLIKFAGFLEKIRALFHKDALQRKLRARAKPVIEKHAGEVFANFELPFNDLKIDDEFNVFLYSSRGEERAEMLSGGERIALALAMRIALSKTLLGTGMTSSGVEMLLLDEPTIHLDELRRKELVEIIKRITYIPQTVIVTHDRDFESSAEKIIFVEKERGVSKIKN